MAEEKILIVEDDFDIAKMLELNLSCNDYSRIRIETSGTKGLAAALNWRPDLILLDIMLPEMDGLTICRLLRANAQTSAVPVIMLTAKNEVADIVAGLESGADDYVTKPFSTEELLARIKTQLRKNHSDSQRERISLDGLELSLRERTVTLNGVQMPLTAMEFDVLHLLLSHVGQVFTRRQLITEVKGRDYSATEHSIDVQLFSIRRKLNPWSRHIETVRGVGFRLKAAP